MFWLRIVLSGILSCGVLGLRSSLSHAKLKHYYGMRAKKTTVVLRYQDSGSITEGDRTFFESKRDEALKTLIAIDNLQQKIASHDDDDIDISELYNELLKVEQEVMRVTSQILPPKGLSIEDYKSAMRVYIRLPFVVREALCEVVGFSGLTSSQAYFKAPEVIARVYEQGPRLTQTRLHDALKVAETRRKPPAVTLLSAAPSQEEEIESLVDRFVEEMSGGKTRDESKKENAVEQFLPRVTRKEGKAVSLRDVDALLAVLGDSSFVVSKSSPREQVPGGYIVRGVNSKTSGGELMEELDSMVPAKWDAQVCYVPDITSSEPDDDPVLLLTSNDLAPTTSRWILSFSTAAALTTAFLFAFESYGNNESIARYISDLTAVGDYSAVNWFNYKLLDLLLPLVLVQGLHEAGHLVIAAKDEIKTSPPTLLPFWILPFMGAQTQIKTSPRDRASLFDFAYLGPLLGIVSSLLLLGFGLQSTVTADAQTIQNFPMLPVEVLKLSTLGGTAVDAFLGNNNGLLLSQDPTTTIPLHPMAVAGFCGLMINSLDLLPLGSTDGGRLSQAIFGRKRHLLLGGFVWVALIFSSLLLEHHDVLLYAWVVNNLTQNDMEIPCRNEVDTINWPRILGASSLWMVAVAALLPME